MTRGFGKMEDFLELGKRIGIRERILLSLTKDFIGAKGDMFSLIEKSFLSEIGKTKYKEVVEEHFGELFGS